MKQKKFLKRGVIKRIDKDLDSLIKWKMEKINESYRLASRKLAEDHKKLNFNLTKKDKIKFEF